MRAPPSLLVVAMAVEALLSGALLASDGASSQQARASPPAAPSPASDVERRVRRYPSAFGEVFVVDEGDLRYLRFGSADGDDQSMIRPGDRGAVPMPYVRTAAVGFAFVPRLERALMIGLGGGAFSSLVRRAYPTASLDAVEINPVVVDVARRYFFVDDLADTRFEIHVEDGARFLTRSRARYDLVLLDAYGEGGVPEPLATRAFFEAARERTSPEGAVLLNLAVEDELEPVLARRFAQAFPACRAFRVPEDDNLVLVGTRAPIGRAALLARAARVEAERKLPFRLVDALEREEPCVSPAEP